METFKTSDNIEYGIDKFGVIHQLGFEKFKYNKKYISIYDTNQYKKTGKGLNYIRMGCVLQSYMKAYGRLPSSLLDYGCGNGSFGELVKSIIPEVYCYDIVNYKLPNSVTKVDELVECDIYTFWDSLEHCEDIDFIKNLKCRMIGVSFPYYHENNFEESKHRKPNEHLHHFNTESAVKFFHHNGWKCIFISDLEDAVRTPTNDQQNILTMFFKRHKTSND